MIEWGDSFEKSGGRESTGAPHRRKNTICFGGHAFNLGTNCTSEYPQAKSSSTEMYITAGEENVCRGQGTGDSAFEAKENRRVRGRSRNERQTEVGRIRYRGGSAFESKKENKAGRGT